MIDPLLALGGLAFIAAAIGFVAGLVAAATRVDHVDLVRAKWVEITVSHDRRRLWVNADTGMLLRIYDIQELVLRD